MQLELGKSYLTYSHNVVSMTSVRENGLFVATNGRYYLPDGLCGDPEHAILSEYRVPSTSKLDETLSERGKRYGEFKGHAKITQELKGVMANCDNWSKLSHSQKEALEMIAHKIGRILNGDPNYADNWVDISGYSQLIVKELEDAVDETTTSGK